MAKSFNDTFLHSYSNNLFTLTYTIMRLPWFKRNGIFFIPISIIGWLIFLCGIAYSVYTFIEINNEGHSVSDILMNFVFSLLIIGAVYSLIAYLTIRGTKGK